MPLICVFSQGVLSGVHWRFDPVGDINTSGPQMMDDLGLSRTRHHLVKGLIDQSCLDTGLCMISFNSIGLKGKLSPLRNPSKPSQWQFEGMIRGLALII
jgi:hypothetical protein